MTLEEQRSQEAPEVIRFLLGAFIIAHGLLTVFVIAISAGILYAGFQALPQA